MAIKWGCSLNDKKRPPEERFPKLAARLDKLEKLFEKSVAYEAGRAGIYVYLRGVYKLYTRWLDNDAVEKQLIRVAALRPHKLRKNASPVAILIAVTSKLPPRSRSCYAGDLMRAAEMQIEPEALKNFIRAQRGTAASKPKKKTPITQIDDWF